jgi:hypothetical protein
MKLEAIFRHKVFKMLLKKKQDHRRDGQDAVLMETFRLQYLPGNRISPKNDSAMENLARHIIRASFSQERMRYLEQEGTVVYTAKDKKTSKSFPAFGWMASMCSHIPNRGEQIVRYYGYYSNVLGENAKQKARTISFPAPSKHMIIQKSSERIGQEKLGKTDSENL